MADDVTNEEESLFDYFYRSDSDTFTNFDDIDDDYVDYESEVAQHVYDVSDSDLNELKVGLSDVFQSSSSPEQAYARILNSLALPATQKNELMQSLRLGGFNTPDALRNAPLAEPYEFMIHPIAGFNMVGLRQSGFHFTLPPEEWNLARSQEPRRFTSVSQTEYSLPGFVELAEVTLEGMLPQADYSNGGFPAYFPKYINKYNYDPPKRILGWLEQLMSKAQPIRLSIIVPPSMSVHQQFKRTGGLLESLNCTVTDLTYGEAFGAPGDYVYSITLTQWKQIHPRRKQIIKPPTTSSTSKPPTEIPIIGQQTGSKDVPKSYIVKRGDTLWDISARFLGSGPRWREIYKLNKETIERECKKRGDKCYPTGWRIWPGTKLNIPPERRN